MTNAMKAPCFQHDSWWQEPSRSDWRRLDSNISALPTNYAHLSQAKRILDVGTGTGIWAIDFADQHPDATVIVSMQKLTI